MRSQTNTRGFAHPLLLLVALVGIMGLIGFAGCKVMTKEDPAQQEVAATLPGHILISGSGDSTSATEDSPSTITVRRSGSAAAEASQQQAAGNAAGQSLPESKQLETKYDVSTPTGSLGQLIYDAKAKRFSNVLYFITPRLMFRAYDVVSAQNIGDFAAQCQSNSACKSLLITDVSVDRSHLDESECYGESYSVECKKITTKVTLKDGKFTTLYYKAVGNDIHQVTIYMLRSPGAPNWVVDKVSVNEFTL